MGFPRFPRRIRPMNQKMTVRACVFLAAFAIASIAVAAVDVPQPVQDAAKRGITAGTLAAPIRYLASDALEGRGPATRGDTLARLYLSTELETLGYLPAG